MATLDVLNIRETSSWLNLIRDIDVKCKNGDHGDAFAVCGVLDGLINANDASNFDFGRFNDLDRTRLSAGDASEVVAAAMLTIFGSCVDETSKDVVNVLTSQLEPEFQVHPV